MMIRTFTVEFTTPAFLGDAEQRGQWRTPPFKALLRHCWRMNYSARVDHQVALDVMRRDEAELFGAASEREGESGRSRVRLRLDRWKPGSMYRWEKPSPAIDERIYLGFGPVVDKKSVDVDGKAVDRGALRAPPAIGTDARATLKLAYPDKHAEMMEKTLRLMQRIGTLGGRNRNGWGSLHLSEQDVPSILTAPLDSALGRDWRECLKLDWPHAVGRDKERGALLWQTRQRQSWQAVMEDLALVRKTVRQRFDFVDDENGPKGRYLLAYPVSKEVLAKDWPAKLRLPNALRFKVMKVPSEFSETGATSFVGEIVHIPCRPPKHDFKNVEPAELEHVWQKVHRMLDGGPDDASDDVTGSGTRITGLRRVDPFTAPHGTDR